MIEFELTDEIMSLVKCLLYQAAPYNGDWVCDCDHLCNCLEIHKVEADVEELVVTTREKVYRLKATRILPNV
jgi:hypothetical protein